MAADSLGWDRAVAFADQTLDRLSSIGLPLPGDGAQLLSRRSLFTSAPRDQQQSMGGWCRLLPSSDGWIAIHLPREDDLELLPAWIGISASSANPPWDEIGTSVRTYTSDHIVRSAQELGLAVSMVPTDNDDEQLVDRGTANPARPWIQRRVGERGAGRPLDGLRVVDLSSLWAGPLCARVLGDGGARIVKVESPSRPDASRDGDAALFEWLHADHEFRSIAFDESDGVAELVELLEHADVVIEGSRPRALDRLGIAPAEIVAKRPGTVWVSITAFGRCGPWRDRVGFGDDTAVAGGLIEVDANGRPGFVGDAVADPLTGLVAAALVADAVLRGGGVTIDVALREVARSAARSAQVVW